ncbi:MAG: hypothetical protein JW991_01870 [Candidatus Pacebacteria bacterium]|nr:hypothetical protein [Candidatus Paceibacterota bacterium]
MTKTSFIEVCLYEVRPDRTEEFEMLIKKVLKHHQEFPGVKDVRYLKRTYRPVSFSGAKRAEPAIKLTRKPQSVTYVLCWELDNPAVHAKATQSGLKHFFKEFARCLIKPPKIILGERIN